MGAKMWAQITKKLPTLLNLVNPSNCGEDLGYDRLSKLVLGENILSIIVCDLLPNRSFRPAFSTNKVATSITNLQ